MKYTYEEINTDINEIIIKRTDENGVIAWIPTDEGNSDYQRYLNPELETAQSTPNVTEDE
jgi:hypothetical protein